MRAGFFAVVLHPGTVRQCCSLILSHAAIFFVVLVLHFIQVGYVIIIDSGTI